MSMILAAQALKIKVGNPTRKLVLVKLADNANDDGVCFPSYQNIAAHCEISRQTAINHINALIEMGLVSKQERKTTEGNTSNLYILHLEGSQNIRPGVVKNFDQGSQNIRPGVVKNFDPESININQSINHTNLAVSNTRANKTEKIDPENLDGLVFEDQTLQDFGVDYIDRAKWSAYCKMRKAKGKSAEIKTQGTLESILKNLLKLSGGNAATASEILDQSIANTWTGLFELKSKKQQVTNAQHDEFADNGTWAKGRTLNIPVDILPEALRDE